MDSLSSDFYMSRKTYIVPALSMITLAFVLMLNAWIVDDAYITFRVVDNFVNGFGLSWNTAERVQAYTHPLWMLLVSAVYYVSNEIYFSTIILSLVLSLVAVTVVLKIVNNSSASLWWKSILLVMSLVASKAVIDYASSGLENPLSYLIWAIFIYFFLPMATNGTVDNSRAGLVLFFASLAFVNRPDTILIYLPSLTWLLYGLYKQSKTSILKIVFLSTLPATIWVLFSLIYYGYPAPNTAYAKALSTGLPLALRISRGLEYQINSLAWDPASYIILLSATFFVLRTKSLAMTSIIGGVYLYILFVITCGATATHMSGRFYALPLFAGCALFAYSIKKPGHGLLAGLLLSIFIVIFPLSPIKFGSSSYKPFYQNSSYIDTKWYVYKEGAALLNWRPGVTMPDHDWFKWGRKLSYEKRKVLVGGVYGLAPIGYAGFAAGPQIHFVDPLGLTDPLLSKLRAISPHSLSNLHSGHFKRIIPAGYVESLESNKNLIKNPALHEYYDLILKVTQGPLFSWDRMKTIILLNLGQYDYLLERYHSQQEIK